MPSGTMGRWMGWETYRCPQPCANTMSLRQGGGAACARAKGRAMTWTQRTRVVEAIDYWKTCQIAARAAAAAAAVAVVAAAEDDIYNDVDGGGQDVVGDHQVRKMHASNSCVCAALCCYHNCCADMHLPGDHMLHATVACSQQHAEQSLASSPMTR